MTTTTYPCLCCGRTVFNANPQQPIHLDCWDEHHSDPTGVWPPEHSCEFDRGDDEDGCWHDWMLRPESDTHEWRPSCNAERPNR